jgi:hypothetical protein
MTERTMQTARIGNTTLPSAAVLHPMPFSTRGNFSTPSRMELLVHQYQRALTTAAPWPQPPHCRLIRKMPRKRQPKSRIAFSWHTNYVYLRRGWLIHIDYFFRWCVPNTRAAAVHERVLNLDGALKKSRSLGESNKSMVHQTANISMRGMTCMSFKCSPCPDIWSSLDLDKFAVGFTITMARDFYDVLSASQSTSGKMRPFLFFW